ncbi:DUF1579 domain-containing protein [Massilia arenosa]|uniref:DUF1579 domain-containing protein n=1 Tax=Zemynaea arenosa TaxID=2561931 RepID=A0A4Y9RP39_9BURK|nr:DUF1579 domain-containing protein [Massilia arenosa]TFW10622.1 DUF1579 domain-containing protein [Massilia arenosa]
MDALAPLGPFLGTWEGEEEIMPSKWGPGGPAHAQAVWRADLGGKAVIHEYRAVRDGAPWLQAHALFTPQANGGLALHWFDSLGFVPEQAALGSAEGAQLLFVRRSPRGMSRHVWAPLGADAYTLALDTSFDAGASWTPIMRGRYTRTAAED